METDVICSALGDLGQEGKTGKKNDQEPGSSGGSEPERAKIDQKDAFACFVCTKALGRQEREQLSGSIPTSRRSRSHRRVLLFTHLNASAPAPLLQHSEFYARRWQHHMPSDAGLQHRAHGPLGPPLNLVRFASSGSQ